MARIISVGPAASVANVTNIVSDGLPTESGNKHQNHLLSRYLDLTFKSGNKVSQNFGDGFGFPHGQTMINGKIYCGLRQSPAIIIKFNDLEDLSNITTYTFPSDSNHNEAESMTYDSVTNRIYIAFGQDDTRLVVSSIDPDLTSHTDVISTTSFGAGASPGIDTDNTNLYVITGTSPATIRKYDIATFTLQTSVTLTGLNGGHAIQYDGTNLYGTGLADPAWIVKVNTTDLTYSQASLLAGEATFTDDMAMTSDYVWCGCEAGTLGQGLIARFKKSDLTIERIQTGVLGSVYAVFFDGAWLWAGVNGAPGYLVRIDPSTLDLAFLTLDSGEEDPNEIFTDGQRLFLTTFTSPGLIIKLANPALDSERYLGAGVRAKRRASSGNATLTNTDYYLGITSTASARTVNLPALANTSVGKTYIIQDESGGAQTNNIIIDPAGSELIDGIGSRMIVTNYGGATVMNIGSGWISYKGNINSVTSLSGLTSNLLVRGDGVRNVKTSVINVDNSGNITGIGSLTGSNIRLTGSIYAAGVQTTTLLVGQGEETIQDILMGITGLSFGAINQSSSAEAIMELKNAKSGAGVFIGIQPEVFSAGTNMDNGAFSAWVSGTGSIAIRYTNNHTLVQATPATGSYRAVVFNY